MTLSSGSTGYLSGLGRFGIRPGLENVRTVLELLDHPEKAVVTFQIVGTNGKGSTASYLESVLRAAGYRTGRYTSPHLADVRERISLSGEMIPVPLFEELLGELRRCLDDSGLTLSFFECLTVLAFMAFRKASCQIAVLEAGMGGRWDATTACDPVVTVLTQVAIDHEQILGKGLVNIFGEKVAVGRSGRPFVACLEDPLLRDLFLRRARDCAFIPVLDRRDFSGEWSGWGQEGDRSAVYEGRWGRRTVSSGLTASYQIGNLSAAMAAIEWSALPVSPWILGQGIRAAVNPGRFEMLSTSPPILLDGAHNLAAVRALVRSISDRFGASKSLGFFIGIHDDKDWREMMEVLAPLGQTYFFPTDPSLDLAGEVMSGPGVVPGWVPPALLESAVRSVAKGREMTVRTGSGRPLLQEAKAWAGQENGRLLVVTGSLYLVGAVRSSVCPVTEPSAFPWNERDLPGPDLS